MSEGHTERLEAALDGKYRIERKLGEGGMASVYLAEDIKHERKVALKILRPELAAVLGAERFLSEIKTTASLQHPHILALHDSGEAEGYLYYVMPYIDGETLREKLDREKQLGVEEAVRIARDVADALDYAHRAGVIHRDIKPGNILLHDGRPVVADFGIALAVSAAGGGRMTETGLSLGTPHYMSPEQASADRDLSARSDVYSLGCVLYEMIAGQPPHTGPSAQSILVRIMTKEATPLSELRHTVPPNVAATVAKSIEKLPADRFESAKEFVEALEDEGFKYQAKPRTGGLTQPPVATAVAPARPWLRDGRSAAALVFGLAMTALAAFLWLQPGAPLGVPTRAEATGLDLSGPPASRLAISPDGRWIVSVGGLPPALYLRAADDLEWRQLPNTLGAFNPTFAPDGQSVAFNRTTGGIREIVRVPITGGPALPVASAGSDPHWGDADLIVYRNLPGAIYRVASSGGEPEILLQSDTIRAAWPHLLPGGEGVVFSTVTDGSPLDSRIILLEIETGEVRELVASGNRPRYLVTGHLVYGHGDDALMGVPFDLESLQATGSAVTLLPELAVSPSGAAQFAVSRTGTLVYGIGMASDTGGESPLAWVDMRGVVTDIPVSTPTARVPRVSPQGDYIAFEADEHIWVHDVSAGLDDQLTFEGINRTPVWSVDGRYVYFLSERPGTTGPDLFRKAVDGSAGAELLLTGDGEESLTSVSPDGMWLVMGESSAEGGRDIGLVPLGADSATSPTAYLRTELSEAEGSVSPNGQWMAFWSSDLGGVFVQDFPEPVGRWRVSQSGTNSFDPVWAPNGEALYYSSGGTLVRAEVETQGSFDPGATSSLFTWGFDTGGPFNVGFDIHPDGDRFAVVTSAGSNNLSGVYLVTNWFEELRERMGEN